MSATATRSTEKGPTEAFTDVVKNSRAVLSGRKSLRKGGEQAAQKQSEDQGPDEASGVPPPTVADQLTIRSHLTIPIHYVGNGVPESVHRSSRGQL